MIRPLRQLHHRTFIALGVGLPLVFAYGLVARKPFPKMDAFPAGLAAATTPFSVMVWDRDDFFLGQAPIHVRLWREPGPAGALAVTFSAASDYFIKPDLMVYWVPGTAPIKDRPPATAQLLGGFDAAALPLPSTAATTNGELVLYSLANQEIVAVSRPMPFTPADHH